MRAAPAFDLGPVKPSALPGAAPATVPLPPGAERGEMKSTRVQRFPFPVSLATMYAERFDRTRGLFRTTGRTSVRPHSPGRSRANVKEA